MTPIQLGDPPLVAGVLNEVVVVVANAVLADERLRLILPGFGEGDVTVEMNVPFSQVTAPGCRRYGLDLNSDYTDSPGIRRGSSSGDGHVTDGTELSRSLFSTDGIINIFHVFDNSSSVRMRGHGTFRTFID
jgi:hypothetical protein